MNSIEQCIIARARHEQELKMTLKKLSERQLQIQQCKVQEVQSSVTDQEIKQSEDCTDEEIEKKNWKHIRFHGKDSGVSTCESSSTDTPLEPEGWIAIDHSDHQIYEQNDNQIEQNAAKCVDERAAALLILIANLTLDKLKENKRVQKQIKKARTHH
ncbi:hypothetical protein Tco_1531394 [Tanacetum coccineum]